MPTLSQREWRADRARELAAEGLTVRQVAKRLGVSIGTAHAAISGATPVLRVEARPPATPKLAKTRIFEQKTDAVEPGRIARNDQPRPVARDDYPADLITGPAIDPPGIGQAWYAAPRLRAGYDVSAELAGWRRMREQQKQFDDELAEMQEDLDRQAAEDAPVLAALKASTEASKAKLAKLRAEGEARESEHLKQQRAQQEEQKAASAARWDGYFRPRTRPAVSPLTRAAEDQHRHLADAAWTLTTDWIEKGEVIPTG